MQKERSVYEKYIKRVLDIVCALSAIIVFSWLYLILAVLVRVKLGSPVIFSQERPGKIDEKTGKERIFKLYKFRSMSNATDENGKLLPDKQRLTKFGRILRSTSLDELPEAWNILKGDMSVVGPRPWGLADLKYFTEEERKRHLVRPGLSGWAQVNGRTASAWNQRIEHDIEYVENVSFIFDVKILFMTVINVIKRSDIVTEAEEQGYFSDYRKKQWAEGTVEMPQWYKEYEKAEKR
ncbi:MAG: sugar transferase [Clostridiales bacterium]|nr:sugar transferase [Clostridiales bacterium]